MRSGSNWKKVSIFITSTFRDMHAERDHLMQVVFPELQERLRKRRRYFEPIDLRWGVETASITEVESKNLKVLQVCAEEIEHSRPFQIVLLGDRYGWVPPPERLAAAARLSGLRDSIDGLSVTAFEIEVGTRGRNSADQRCFIYCRKPLPYERMPTEKAASYSDRRANAAAAERIDALKQELARRCPGRFRMYEANWDETREQITGLEPFGRAVLDDLWGEIERQIRQDATETPESWQLRQTWQIDQFNSDHLRHFVGRHELLTRSKAFATGPPSPNSTWGWCLTGDAGAGKSALLAKLAAELSGEPCLVLMHAAGAVENGPSVSFLLRRWIEELGSFLGMPADLPDDAPPERLDEVFAYRMAEAAKRTRVVVLLDAISRLEPTDRGRYLTWLPHVWPDNARLIATSRPSEASWALAGRGCRVETVPAVTRADALAITAAICAGHHRTLNNEITEGLLARRDSRGAAAFGNPLWLTLVVHHLNAPEADDFVRAEEATAASPEQQLLQVLHAAVGSIPTDIPAAYRWLLEKAKKRHGEPALLYAALLAISDVGWRESDLRTLMSRFLDAEWPELEAATLRRTFRQHLIERGEGQWDFAHDQIRRAILAAEGLLPVSCEKLHKGIADYLETLPGNDLTRRGALMRHYLAAGNLERAARHLASALGEQESYVAILEIARAVVDRGAAGASVAWLSTMLQTGELSRSDRATVARRLREGLTMELARAGETRTQAAVIELLCEFWQGIVTDEPKRSGWRYEWAGCLFELGHVYRQLGNGADAMAKYGEALSIIDELLQPNEPKPLRGRSMDVAMVEDLAAEDPDSYFERAKWGELAVICLCAIGDLLAAQGRLDFNGAQGAYTRASGIRHSSQMENLLASRYILRQNASVAVLQMRLGYVSLLMGVGYAAYRQFETALSQIRQFSDLDPLNLAVRRETALLWGRESQALRWESAPGAAALTCHKAIELMTELVRHDPSKRSWHIDLGYFHLWHGDALKDLGHKGAARWNYCQARDLVARIAEADPDNQEWQRSLAEVRMRLPERGETDIEVGEPLILDAGSWDFDPLSGMKAVRSGDTTIYSMSATTVVASAEALDPSEASRRRREAEGGPRFSDWQNTLGGAELAMRRALAAPNGGVPTARPFRQTLEELRHKAETGDGHAQHQLAMEYWEGKAVRQNLAEAETWLRSAAEQGMTGAQYDLGVLLLSAQATVPNRREGIRWWQLAAQAGNAAAQYNLGIAYGMGADVERNPERAAAWIGRAAQQGLAQAQYHLGHYFISGFGVSSDPAQAAKWYQCAAAQGYGPAEHNLGYLYLEGRGVERDVRKGLDLLRKAAERGSIRSQYDLGVLLGNGTYCPPEPERSAAWIADAAKGGSPEAQFNLGSYYLAGFGVRRDSVEAAEWYLRAADQGLAKAQLALGSLYLQGIGVRQDVGAGLDWIRKSAQQGDANGQFALGILLSDGKFCAPEAGEALQWFRRAADQGLPAAQYQLGLMHLHGHNVARDEKLAISLLRGAAEQGFEPAGLALQELGRAPTR